MKTLKPLGLALALLLVMASVSMAGPGQKGRGIMHGPGYGPGMGPGYGYSQLTEEQQQALQDIYAERSGELYSLGSKHMAKRAELNAELAASEVDETRINNLVQEINELRSEMFSQRIQMSLEMRKQGLYQFGPGMMGQSGFCPGSGPGMIQGGPGMGYDMMQGPGMMQHRPWGSW
ncbi:MAG: periplasmic heavy metal sensor [Desulfohalobiaceae bacterium]